MKNYIEGLKKKHAQLEKNIKEENLRPCPNLRLIIELKQKKLHLKEEIQMLMRSEASYIPAA